MAGTEKVLFSRGPRATMPETKVPGTILITTDTREMFLDDTEDSRIQIGGYVDTIIADIEITEEVSTYRTSTLTSDKVEALKNADIIYFCANLAKPSKQTSRGNLLASIYGGYYHATKIFPNDKAYTNVTPSSSAYGGDIAESISVKNEAGGNYFQWIRWKNTDNQYGGDTGNPTRTSIVVPGGSVFNLSTDTVFGVGTTAKLIARRFL